jgi:ADP-heptose:LPS heptosyltransferase
MGKILLTRTDRIGDAVLITPAIELLKKSLPNTKISVLVSPYAKDIFTDNPDIDEIITVKPLFELVRELKQKKFDTCILFFVEPKTALACFLAGIKQRIGPASKIWSVFLNKMVFQHRSKVKKHEADFNIELLKLLGIKPRSTKTHIMLNEAQNLKAQNFLKEKYAVSKDDLLICIHPGSKGSARNWPPENFAKLADSIVDNYRNFKIMLTGAKNEQHLLNEISTLMQKKPLLLKETLALKDFIGILNQSKIVITNSTGPLHIADALSKKTISFFPNIKACLPYRWGPYGHGHLVLMPHDKECPLCKGQKGCMDKITPYQAFEKFRELVGKV